MVLLTLSPAAVAEPSSDAEAASRAAGQPRDGRYNLFTAPAPPDFHRPLGPDPHPYTVEPGRLQIELEPVNYAYDRHNPERADRRTRAWEVPVNLKLGVLHDVDFQVGFQAFSWEREDDVAAGTTSRTRGFGDVTLRSKINLWGNDGQTDHAFALMPFVTLPTARHDAGSRGVEGGVMFPFATAAGDDWELIWSPHLAAVRDDADRDYELEFGSLLGAVRSVSDDVEAFVEFEVLTDTAARDDWAGTINTGLTYAWSTDTFLEGGVMIGVTRAADDVASYFAIVQRF